MSLYRASEFLVDLGRSAALLDTNVLFAAFMETEQNYEDARYYLGEIVDQSIVPSAVLVETWGMLVGSRKRPDLGLRLLEWIEDPGNNVVLLPSYGERFSDVRAIVNQLRVDCVDAILMAIADEISSKCRNGSPVLIATFDTRDFVRAWQSRASSSFSLFDLNTFEELKLGH
jgi:predicted nucleic acid-binding protein